MAVISFQFTHNTNPEQQERTLKKLRALSGVRVVDRIDSESNDQDISRMCFAEVADSTSTQTVLSELHKTVDVEGVAVEPKRGLVS